MVQLPTGTLTFLFTDIEGSTDLLTALGDRYRHVLERHHELLRTALAAHDGVEVMTEGDAFFVVFTSPIAGVRAALDAQRALYTEQWPDGARVRVRMGLHTGEAVLGGDNYLGLDVHRAARIASAGHGGQILLSDATRALVEQSLPPRVSLRDLGRHRLKGLPAEERILQLDIEGVPSDFPYLNTVDARPNNLPPAVTSFIGRERQISEIRERLSSTRLLTLTGPGGTGKTRLGVRVAEELTGEYEHGCWFVALETLRDPELVPSAIASAIGFKEPADQAVLESLGSWLAERELLLVLDNFEQVTPAAPAIAHLLAGAPRLRVLATSRAPLHVYGEQEYPVPPLASVADLRTASATVEALSAYEAVQLFIERALAVKPDFRVTNSNAPAVAELCARLDGLPLAIELAAARVKLLTPEQMLDRLERSFTMLASSAQDLPERQRTLHGAIDWSHELLSRAEQRLFARLSVFRGGLTLDAGEHVCTGDDLGVDVFDGLSSLVDKSLLHAQESDAEVRFTMLETIGEYARKKLADLGESDAIEKRHTVYFLTLAASAESHLAASGQGEWLDRLEREHANLRAAFDRAAEVGMLHEALTAAGAVWRFWQLQGRFVEARSIVERLLAQPGAAPGPRAKALTGAGGIAYWQGDFDAMARHYREAHQLYESAGDIGGMADAIYNESFVPLLLEGDMEASRTLLVQAVDLYRQSGNELGAAGAESAIGISHYFDGNPAGGIPYQERAVEVFRAAGSSWQLGQSLFGLAMLYAQLGDWQRATQLSRESLAIVESAGREVGLAAAFEVIGSAAAWVGDLERGARLFGKAEALKDRLGGGAPLRVDVYRQQLREHLGEERFERLLSEGAGLPISDAVALARQFEPPAGARPLPAAQTPGRRAGSEQR